jgi:hypothetical protein
VLAKLASAREPSSRRSASAVVRFFIVLPCLSGLWCRRLLPGLQ